MSDICKYEFHPELNILFKNYYGPISIEDIFSSWEYAINNDIIPSDLKGFILDFREATFDFKTERFIEIVDFYKRSLDTFLGKKVALISTNPSDLVVPILFNSKDKDYVSKSFSTREAAIEWLLKTDF
jgi:hypothetical protein